MIDAMVNKKLTPFFPLIHTVEIFTDAGSIASGSYITAKFKSPVVFRLLNLSDLNLSMHFSQFWISWSWSWDESDPGPFVYPPVSSAEIIFWWLGKNGLRIPNPGSIGIGHDSHYSHGYPLKSASAIITGVPATGLLGLTNAVGNVYRPSGHTINLSGFDIEFKVNADLNGDTSSAAASGTFHFLPNQTFFINRAGLQPS